MLRYCAALEKEIVLMGKRFSEAEITTVFLGGGTPSLVPAEGMERVLGTLRSVFSFDADVEFTSEANPGTLSEQWLECLMKYGLNRLSLGVQATQDRLLKSLGRIHSFDEAVKAYTMARKAGIRNINMDLMYGLPGQTMEDWKETLDTFCCMGPEHISAYSLILEEGTPLYDMEGSGAVCVPDDDTAAEMYSCAKEKLTKEGYAQYEISNYAKPGRECRHNVGYWQGAWYLGLGVNAHSMLPPQNDEWRMRCFNESDTLRYMEMLETGNSPRTGEERISREEAMFETMMLGLRMNCGVNEKMFFETFGEMMHRVWPDELKSLESDGLAVWEDGCFRLTERGLILQNDVLLRLMK
jgi:oxygen-independent coproporphyrinogen-3 oxidase